MELGLSINITEVTLLDLNTYDFFHVEWLTSFTLSLSCFRGRKRRVTSEPIFNCFTREEGLEPCSCQRSYKLSCL